MRSLVLLPVLMGCGMTVATAADPVSTVKPRCESKTPGGDARDFTCPLQASGITQRFRFKADFSGSHDDTRLSLSATLNGTPLACEQGSKTEREGEDGDVSLECRFSLTGKAGTQHVLGVKLSWRHAQYADFALVSE